MYIAGTGGNIYKCLTFLGLDIGKALHAGLIPSLYFSDSPDEDLRSYIENYLTHEIAAEGATRNIPAFSRFLEVASMSHGQILNYTKISNDCQIPRSTVQEYFGILRDTLIGSDLKAFEKTQKRKALSTAKFYFFDGGVVRALRGLSLISPKSSDWGWAFEGFLHHELRTFIDTLQAGDGSLHVWRSTQHLEVDFILNGEIAIEVKAAEHIQSGDLKSLRALREEKNFRRFYLVCQERDERVVDGISIIPWQHFLKKLWARDL